MSEISALIGNEKNISHIKEALKLSKLSHAYIINGEKGSGKKTFANYVAAMLLCNDEIEKSPCGICPSCIKAATKNHPDIIRTTHEKPLVLSVDEIRDQVIANVDIAPYYGPYKIYIIQDGNLMNDNGQNALLKTIEEPPEHVVIFILTENCDSILQTIKSRCIRLDMEKLSMEQIKDYLKKSGVEEGIAKESALISGGNLGLAIELSKDGKLREMKSEIVSTLKNLGKLDALEILQIASKADKTNYNEILDFVLKWYRDVLCFKINPRSEDLYFSMDKAVIQRQADKISFEGLGRILDKTVQAYDRIKYQVKPEAVIETLLITARMELK